MMQTGVLAPAAEFVDLIAVGRGSVEANEQALAVALASCKFVDVKRR